jgi:riboflavin synthase
MFTGIIEEVGTVRDVKPFGNGRRITIAASIVTPELRPGDSIAVDGVCQTVVAPDEAGFTVEAIATTLERTTLALLERGHAVNLERPLAAGARLGGHFVQGHVDAVGTITGMERSGEHVLLNVKMPAVVAEVTVLHGSIAINGVSLTVNALPCAGEVQVALIPFTWENTSFRHLAVGDRVNLEGDMIGRFVAHLLARRATSADSSRGDHGV